MLLCCSVGVSTIYISIIIVCGGGTDFFFTGTPPHHHFNIQQELKRKTIYK
jgi:hypothetical protein